ncbi:hypothetical protein FD754_003616, partial [Muntiacus muntjak]
QVSLSSLPPLTSCSNPQREALNLILPENWQAGSLPLVPPGEPFMDLIIVKRRRDWDSRFHCLNFFIIFNYSLLLEIFIVCCYSYRNLMPIISTILYILFLTFFKIVGPYPSWWVFNLLLLVIQGLNCFWSYLIVKIACKAISKGKSGKWNPLHVSKDDRSDIESSSDEEDSEPPGKNPHTSTTTNGTSGTNGYLLTGACAMDD